MVDKVLHAQMPFTTGRQTINDRLTAAYHSLAGSQLGKTVCKATTEESIGPKKKHLDYLLHCTNEPNVSIPQLANCLIERTTSANWCTVFKSLITIHNLMCYGNERFSQYLASSNANFNLGNFLDKTTVQGYDMSTHVRRYARYIGEKIFTYRMMAFDFCKVKRGREDGLLRTMPTEKLLKTLPLLQGQIDALLEFQVSSNELTNGVINSCFILLFRDLIRLFACYNDGVINLLEKFFDMNKKQCREALELYKNFLTRMDKVAEFLKVAESVGIDKCEIPDLAKAPSSLIEALEQHLAALEGQKGSGSRVTSPTSGPSLATQSAIQMFSTTGGFSGVDAAALDEHVKQKILQEEEQRLNMLKEQRLRELEFSDRKASLDGGPGSSTAYLNKPKTNPFLTTPVNDAAAKSSSIDDLLSLDLGNLGMGAPPPVAASTNPFQTGFDYRPTPAMGGQQLFGATPSNGYANGHSAASGFASDDTFARAFAAGQQQQSHASNAALGDLMAGGQSSQQSSSFPKTMQPQKQTSKFVKGDLDSSLASLAENLNISKAQDGLKNKPVQWGPQRPGAGPQPTFGAPMQPAMGGYGAPAPGQNPYGYQPGWPPAGQQQQAPGGMMMGGAPNMQYAAAPYGQMPARPMYGMPAAPAGQMGGGYGGAPAPMRPTGPPPGGAAAAAQDPFGAL